MFGLSIAKSCKTYFCGIVYILHEASRCYESILKQYIGMLRCSWYSVTLYSIFVDTTIVTCVLCHCCTNRQAAIQCAPLAIIKLHFLLIKKKAPTSANITLLNFMRLWSLRRTNIIKVKERVNRSVMWSKLRLAKRAWTLDIAT